MRPLLLIPALLLSAATAHAQATASDHSSAAKPSAPAAMSASDIEWGPVPPVLPAGAQIAVLQGNPFAAGVYTLRLKMPDGYSIAPHFHPTDEMVTVVSGTLLYGHGDKVDRPAMAELNAGGFATFNKNEHHYVTARGETIVQVHGMGPFSITYVNPKDDPQRTAGAKP
jgi:quercetin dioxygenase-like cupin family protein